MNYVISKRINLKAFRRIDFTFYISSIVYTNAMQC